MVDSMDIYKYLNIRIGTIISNQEMLKPFSDHLKTKKMCKHVVTNLSSLIRCAPERYNTQQMCDKAILENGGTLKSVLDCHKNKKICNKAADNYPHALEFVPECYKTQKICQKAGVFLYLILFLINIKLKKCVTEMFLKIHL